MREHKLTTYIRTKNVFQHRLKDLPDYDWVKIYSYEIKNLGLHDNGILQHLTAIREITTNGKGQYKATEDGPINPSLLEEGKKKEKVNLPLSVLHKWMRGHLSEVKLVGVQQKDIPVYFNSFLKSKEGDKDYFFKVDSFSTRVHTPVVSLKGDLRFKIRFYGEKVASLDVVQMQPTILAKVLDDAIGANAFSDAIFSGEDVYILIQKEAQLASRKDAKDYFFKLIFGQPMNDIGRMFKGDSKWVEWINDYKRRDEPQNPHGRWKRHTNLAWLLQYSEVQVMTDVWTRLMEENIPFLSIHDEILCRFGDKERVEAIMNRELRKHFRYFKVVSHLN